MNRREKKIFSTMLFLALTFGVTQNVFAMHIMEGFLPQTQCIAYGVLCLPFIAVGVSKIKKLRSENGKVMLLLAMVGAFAFLLSALKIPSVTGSSSHPTGTGIGAILFGPWVMSVLGLIILLFQAILLAHGGITTLGANTFSMGIAGPFVSSGVYMLLKKLNVDKKVAVFLAVTLGDFFTYCVTSFQLGFAYPDAVGGVMASLTKFLTVFAVTQVPIAIVEGLLSVVLLIGLETFSSRELKTMGFMEGVAINE